MAAILAVEDGRPATTSAGTSCPRASRGADRRGEPRVRRARRPEVIACARPLPALIDAYRSGGGVPFADYGEDLIDRGRGSPRRCSTACSPAMARASRSTNACGRSAARVADVACGEGRSSFAIARAYPKVTRRRHRPRRGLDRGRGAPRRERRRGPRHVPLPRRRRPGLAGGYDLVDDLRVAPRHVAARRRAAGRRAACSPRAAAS